MLPVVAIIAAACGRCPCSLTRRPIKSSTLARSPRALALASRCGCWWNGGLRPMRKRKLPPVKQTRVRKGNHPSNPYAEGLTDREGLSIDIEPVLEIRASERHGPETVETVSYTHLTLPTSDLV